MNELLQLKGNFQQKKSNSKPGPSNIPKEKSITIEHLFTLKNDLEKVRDFWLNESLNIKPLISLYYIDVIAKSNRIKAILESGINRNNDSIVGAKFTNTERKKHIITHCITDEILLDAINNIDNVIKIIKSNFNSEITHDDINDINKHVYDDIFNENRIVDISKTKFVNIVVDSYYLENFGVERNIDNLQETAIITLYDTGTKTENIMRQLNIDLLDVRYIDETTILLSPEQYEILKSKAPYLIAMAVRDISSLEKETILKNDCVQMSIPKPKNEPTVGVIDTMFDENVYFSEWVEFENKVDSNISLNDEDYQHGTMVSSIIVDGHTNNPELNDGCGRFKVRHFGVSTSGYFSSFSILRSIKEIVETNKDIKVWNLSLGSSLEINENFISPEAAILDKIQFENNVIFVVSGTNKDNRNMDVKRIGAPADSINSLVVNSVGFNGKPASYSREGLVLSFFNKPDVSYYGGDDKKGISVCASSDTMMRVSGTSFAAPWITRKVAYLIEILGLSRELAKALLIDSAAKWEKNPYSSQLIGYGVVPIKIEDIIKTPDDEIKFMVSGISQKYDTYNYNIPIPEDGNEKQPFISKATLCYFPNCSRNQGVDYTNTELDIHFGRLQKNKKNGYITIKTIDDNKQADEAKILMYEGTARKLYRKWDNVKHIRENIKTPTGKVRAPKIKKENGLWGISIKTKERLNTRDGNNLNFGLVVTLKEVNGINRINEFIQQCFFRGWLVNRIDIENRIDVYNKAEEEITFE